MHKSLRWIAAYGVVWAAMLLWAGLVACSNSNESEVPEVFIQINESIITVDAYLREVDEFVADMAADKDTVSEIMASIRLRVLNQLTERLMLFERAKELGIKVSEKELEAVVTSIKSDYPKGEFDQVLLKQAVSYSEWENDMRTRLLMQKVIDQELEPKVRVTPEEISAYYEQHYVSAGAQANQSTDAADLETTILQQVRNEKKEALYRDWLENLKRSYHVNVNQSAWDRIMAP